MRGTLRIFRTEALETGDIYRFLDRFLQDHGRVHLLVSDGVILDLRSMFSNEERDRIYVQRVLTSYQFERILMDSDENPFFIAIRSDVISEWKVITIESIYDILRIKSMFRGCHIWMNIVGPPGIFQKYLGEWRFRKVHEDTGRGLYAWDGQHQQ